MNALSLQLDFSSSYTKSYIETSGIMINSVNNTTCGNINGKPTIQPGYTSNTNSLNFNGTNQSIKLDPIYIRSGGISINFWIYIPSENITTERTIINFSYTDINNTNKPTTSLVIKYSIEKDSSGNIFAEIYFGIYYKDNTKTDNTRVIIRLLKYDNIQQNFHIDKFNKWINYTWTISDTLNKMILYENGVQPEILFNGSYNNQLIYPTQQEVNTYNNSNSIKKVYTSIYPPTSVPYISFIGSNLDSKNFFSGNIANFRMYNSVLDPTTVKNLYDNDLKTGFNIANATLRSSVDDTLYKYIFSDLFTQNKDANNFVNTNNSSFKFNTPPSIMQKQNINSANDCLNLCKGTDQNPNKSCTSYSYDTTNKICYNYNGIFPNNIYDNVPNVISGYNLNYQYNYTSLTDNEKKVIKTQLANRFLKDKFNLNENVNIEKCLSIDSANNITTFNNKPECIYNEYKKNNLPTLDVKEEEIYKMPDTYLKAKDNSNISTIIRNYINSILNNIKNINVANYLPSPPPPAPPVKVVPQSPPVTESPIASPQTPVPRTLPLVKEEEIKSVYTSSSDILFDEIPSTPSSETQSAYKSDTPVATDNLSPEEKKTFNEQASDTTEYIDISDSILAIMGAPAQTFSNFNDHKLNDQIMNNTIKLKVILTVILIIIILFIIFYYFFITK